MKADWKLWDKTHKDKNRTDN